MGFTVIREASADIKAAMRNLVTGWMIQQDGGIAHAVDLDAAPTMTVCNEGPVDVTAEAWAAAPTPRCKRCSDALGDVG